MSEGRKKYLIPIITSVVASVLLIAVLVSCVYAWWRNDYSRETMLYSSGSVFISVQIPEVKSYSSDEVFKFKVGVANHENRDVYTNGDLIVAAEGFDISIGEGEWVSDRAELELKNFDTNDYGFETTYRPRNVGAGTRPINHFKCKQYITVSLKRRSALRTGNLFFKLSGYFPIGNSSKYKLMEVSVGASVAWACDGDRIAFSVNSNEDAVRVIGYSY